MCLMKRGLGSGKGDASRKSLARLPLVFPVSGSHAVLVGTREEGARMSSSKWGPWFFFFFFLLVIHVGPAGWLAGKISGLLLS